MRNIPVTVSTAGQTFTNYFDSGNYEVVTFVCEGLGAAESTAIALESPAGTFSTVRDSDGNALTFTGSGGSPANRTMLTLVGGPVYRFTSTTPAGVVTIDAIPGQGLI
jgi:hypothetical protein